MVKKLAMLVVMFSLSLSTVGYARSVFLNGVDISGVRGNSFRNATVSIDANGDIRIDAPGYKVEVVGNDSAPPPVPVAPPPAVAPLVPVAPPPVVASPVPVAPPRDDGGPNPLLAKRYYLVTQPSPLGRAQYDFIVSINGTDKKTIDAQAPQVIMEISSWLQKGENTVIFTARKNLLGGRTSSSATDEAKIMIGTGSEEAKVVKVDSIKAKIAVNAASLSTVRKSFVLVAE